MQICHGIQSAEIICEILKVYFHFPSFLTLNTQIAQVVQIGPLEDIDSFFLAYQIPQLLTWGGGY